MHPLARYLKAQGLSQRELAQRASIPASTLSRVLSGALRRFSPEAAQRLVEASGGALKLEELLFFRPAEPRPRRKKQRRGE